MPPVGVPDPENDLLESTPWVIIPFTHPTSGNTYDIIDGRVLLALTNTPVFPLMDPNYFDVQLPLDDPFYQMVNYSNMMVGGVATDPAVEAFLSAENLTVFSEWPEAGGMAVLLPPGQTVLDAVANWVTEYPAVLRVVGPDSILTPGSFPADEPNDDRYYPSWHLMADNLDHSPGWYDPLKVNPYAADPTSAWGLGEDALGEGVVIAILDTGVDHLNPGLQVADSGAVPPTTGSSTYHGMNIGQDPETTFEIGPRTEGFGDPWDWLMEESQSQASALGHGTSVAGVACAAADDDPNLLWPDEKNPNDVLGVAPRAKYFSVAMGNQNGVYADSTVLNAFRKIGGLKGIFEDEIPYDAETDS